MSAVLVHRSPGRASAWWQVLRAFMPGWRPTVKGMVLGALLLAIGLPPLLGLQRDGVALRMGLIFSGGLLGIVIWTAVVHGVLLQNSAITARLVPGHVPRLREVLLVSWALLTAAAGAVALGSGANALLTMLNTGVVLLLYAVAMRWPLVWFVFWIVPTELPSRSGRWFDALAREVGADGALLVALGVVLTGVALAGLVRGGGARHLSSRARQATMRRSARGDKPLSGVGMNSLFNSVVHVFCWPYRAWMRRVLERPGESAWPRIQLAFGPGAHWIGHVAWLLPLLALAALGLLWLLVAGWLVPGGVRPEQVFGPAMGLMCAAINPVLGLDASLRRTRGEQALLMLMPGVPHGAALNRGLAGRRLLHFLCGWCAGALTVSGLTVLAPAAASTLSVAVVCLLPVSVWLCADLARRPTGFGPAVAGLVATFVGPPALGLSLHLAGGVAVGPIAIGVVLATAALLAWRWRSLGTMPGAFPVGRLG